MSVQPSEAPPPLVAEELPEAVALRKLIESLQREVSTPFTSRIKALTELMDAVGAWRCSQCKHNNNGVCGGWRLSADLANRLTMLIGGDAIVLQEGVNRFNIAKVSFLGAFCPLFTAKSV